MKRYQSRIKQFHLNRLFHTDQSRLFEELNGKERSDLKPDGEQTKKFWSEIWSKPSQHNRNAEWLNNLKEEISVEKQEPVKVSIDKVRKVLKRMPDWKAPGPDLVQGFWLKNRTSMHDRLTEQLEACLSSGNVPTWMTKGRTVLIIKD